MKSLLRISKPAKRLQIIIMKRLRLLLSQRLFILCFNTLRRYWSDYIFTLQEILLGAGHSWKLYWVFLSAS